MLFYLSAARTRVRTTRLAAVIFWPEAVLIPAWAEGAGQPQPHPADLNQNSGKPLSIFHGAQSRAVDTPDLSKLAINW
ncbi:MAG: hypothetical protein PHW76_03985 [Alphaproteobacteria bacterium]|nr:hypothetical protein [Alphaproteobacteria bacterium]